MPETSAEIATRNREMQRGRKVIYLHPSQYSTSTAPPPSSGGGGGGRQRINRTYINVQNKTVQARPGFLGTQRTIIFAWVVAMALIVADEWKAHGWLPRPARLWWTSLVYGILAVMSQIDALIPLASALALGYTTVLAVQFFNKEGQFSGQ